MKILHLIPEYYIKKKIKLGLEPYIYNLTTNLKTKTLVLTHKTDIKKYKNITTNLVPRVKRFTFFKTGTETYKKIKKENIKFDILHQHNVGFYSIIKHKKDLNVPFVYTLHNSPLRIFKNINWFNFKSIKEGLYFYYFSKLVIDKSDAIIVGSQECKDEVINHFKVNKKKVHFIPAGYDPKVYNIKKVKKENQLLFVGRFVKQKGIITLLKAFNEINKFKPNLKLVLIGANKNDDDYKNVMNTIKEFRLTKSVKILPPIPQKEFINYYRTSKILIAPSTSEGTSQVGIESLACGTPVIATNICGFKDYVINNKTGYTVDIGDYKKIAKLVIKIIDDSKLLKKLGTNGNKFVKENFTWKMMAQKHKNLYKKLLN